MEELTAEISTMTVKLDETQNDQIENTRAMMKVQKNAERYLTKRQTLSNRKEECSNAIRDLGVLPEEAFSKYTDTRPDKVGRTTHGGMRELLLIEIDCETVTQGQ